MPINRFTEVTDGEAPPGFAIRMLNAVEVKLIQPDLFMSRELWHILDYRAAFGGQIIGQSLRAAFYTVPEHFLVHSLHCYFLLPCAPDRPVYYKVDRIRDGRSFITRTVTATQSDKILFVNTCSFTINNGQNEKALAHQTEMPKIVDPDELITESERVSSYDKSKLSKKDIQYILVRQEDVQPILVKDEQIFTAEEYFTGQTKPLKYHRRWSKAIGSLGDDQRLHACALAYASDRGMALTAALYHGLTQRGLGMLASLDHSIWFYGVPKADEWFVHDMETPRTGDNRGVTFGKIYSRDGVLMATTAQECILRPRKSKVQDSKQENTPQPVSKNSKTQVDSRSKL